MPFDGNPVEFEALTELQKTLIKARALIEQGWTQGAMERGVPGSMSYCVVGALRKAKDYRSCFGVERTVFYRANSLRTDIESWNDSRVRTKAQVLEAFDKAIAYAGVNIVKGTENSD